MAPVVARELQATVGVEADGAAEWPNNLTIFDEIGYRINGPYETGVALPRPHSARMSEPGAARGRAFAS